MPVKIGEYIRRLRIRAVGYDAQGNVAGEDEMVINDPRPPFRVRLQATGGLLERERLHAAQLGVSRRRFLGRRGEDRQRRRAAVHRARSMPRSSRTRSTRESSRTRATATKRTTSSFFGAQPSDQIDVTVQQIPLSVAGGNRALQLEDLTLLDDGSPRKIEALDAGLRSAAQRHPAHRLLRIDARRVAGGEGGGAGSSRSALLRPQDRIAIVGFNQRTFWLTHSRTIGRRPPRQSIA